MAILAFQSFHSEERDNNFVLLLCITSRLVSLGKTHSFSFAIIKSVPENNRYTPQLSRPNSTLFGILFML